MATCYLCVYGGTAAYSLSSGQGSAGDSLGCCGICSIFVCDRHALRNSLQRRYECGICIPVSISPRSGPPGGTGGGGSSPSNPAAPKPGGGGGGGGGAQTYSAAEFVAEYPTASQLLQEKIAEALLDVDATVRNYFGERLESRVLPLLSRENMSLQMVKSRLAAAVTFIDFSELPNSMFPAYLQSERIYE